MVEHFHGKEGVSGSSPELGFDEVPALVDRLERMTASSRQSGKSATPDERAEKEFADNEAVLVALNVKTAGGLMTILEAVERTRTDGLSGG